MPKHRDPRRDQARDLYLNSDKDLSSAKIAKKLGLSSGTVRSFQHKY